VYIAFDLEIPDRKCVFMIDAAVLLPLNIPILPALILGWSEFSKLCNTNFGVV